MKWRLYFYRKHAHMGVFGKGSKLYSIFKMKCPRCQEGDFFISKPYDLKRAGDTHERCPQCNLKYSKEPGFYFGAMFVSYGLGVALFVTLWVSFNLFFEDLEWPRQRHQPQIITYAYAWCYHGIIPPPLELWLL